MYKNKYNAQESLERIKLMMGYDVKKTATENIMEQAPMSVYFNTKEKKDDSVVTNQPTSCPNSISYEDLSKSADKVAGEIDKMDTSFVRMGYGLERAQDVYNDVKLLSGKNTFDSVTNQCENAIDKFKEIFKIKSKKNTWFGGGYDIEEMLNKLITGYYADDSDVIRYLNASLQILQNNSTINQQNNIPANNQQNNIPAKKRQQVPIPTELKDKNGVMAFQNWLDGNHPGWATGYRDGILKQGANGGGYGSFGPRTQKGWSQYKQEYLTKTTPEVVNKTPGTPTATQTQTAYQMNDKTKQAAAAAGLT